MSTCLFIRIKGTISANTTSIDLNWLRLRPIHGHLMIESNNFLGTSELLIGRLIRDSDGLSLLGGSAGSSCLTTRSVGPKHG